MDRDYPGRTFIGIDGCRAGWFCVVLREDGDWCCHVVPDASGVGELCGGADTVLIDIPIGLVESGDSGRLCDREARRLLGRGRSSSVFSAPARRTLSAVSYPHALALNRQATGRGLSIQAWGILPKIRDIDRLLSDDRSLRGVLRESHPELCFWSLNGRQAMRFRKKEREGQQERLAVLGTFFPQSHELFDLVCAEFQRNRVARDDIIDAMACAVTARCGHGRYRTVPNRPPSDARGLPMEIVFCEEQGAQAD